MGHSGPFGHLRHMSHLGHLGRRRCWSAPIQQLAVLGYMLAGVSIVYMLTPLQCRSIVSQRHRQWPYMEQRSLAQCWANAGSA